MLVLGREARKYGLATSLLERLLYLYRSDDVPPVFKKLISFLDRCYRCHQDILNLSAHVIYKTVLCIPEDGLPPSPKKFPYPLLFICSSINEEEMPKSTRNHDEAKVILDQAEFIAANWSKSCWGSQYHLDMCAMSPTRSQVNINVIVRAL